MPTGLRLGNFLRVIANEPFNVPGAHGPHPVGKAVLVQRQDRWYARRIGIPCTVIVPDDVPPAKVEATRSLGARIIAVPFAEYRAIQREHACEHARGTLIHPFADDSVVAGNATIGLEILEDLPDVDAVIIPYGGGGLSCGIASVVRSLRPQTKLYATEVATAAPLAASLAAGRPVVAPYSPSFVSGIGGPTIFPRMWDLSRRLLDGSLVVTLPQVTEAIRILCLHHRVVAEGAGAVALAAALGGKAPTGKTVCIVSGGNIDTVTVIRILRGEDPPFSD